MPLPTQDTPTLYGKISRIAHWGGALLVLGLLAIGLYFEELPKGDLRKSVKALHISVGALVWVLLIARILWRVRQNLAGHTPRPLSPAGWQLWVERAVHVGLLGVLTGLLFTGPAIVWSDGKAIQVFGWFAVGSPMSENHDLHEGLEEAHEVLANTLALLLVLHVAGALRHGLSSLRRISGPVR